MLQIRAREHQRLCSSFKGSTIQGPHYYKEVSLLAHTHHVQNKSSDTFCLHLAQISIWPRNFATSLIARGGGPVIKCRPKTLHTLGSGAFHILSSKSGKDLDKIRFSQHVVESLNDHPPPSAQKLLAPQAEPQPTALSKIQQCADT